jgi:hypothetical protein
MENTMGVAGMRAGWVRRGGLSCLAAGAAALTVAACGTHLATPSSASQPTGTGTTGPAGTAGTTPTTAAPAGAAGGGAALCSAAAGVTRLVVSRVNTLPQNHQRFAFPAGVTVADPAQARAVAKALCALPPMRPGPFSCPADMGVNYRLSFAAGQRSFPAVTAAASGCTIVTGIGTPRTAPAQFWTTLTHAMGVAGGSSVLRGTLP